MYFRGLIVELFTDNFVILKIGIFWNFPISVTRELHNHVVRGNRFQEFRDESDEKEGKEEREREREERANNRILIESKFSLTLVIVRSNLKSLKTSGCGSFGHPYKE